MGFIKEFKEFAIKGNLIDTAVAFVMGAAFGKVVSSFVGKMFSPLVGLLLGGIDLSSQKTVVKAGVAAVTDASGTVISPAIEEVAIEWGAFITATIDFIVVAFVMFLVIKAMNRMKKKEEAAAPAPPAGPSQEQLLSEIRDLLKK